MRPAVVVPAYRAADVLPAAVAAFRAQTVAADWIFVDDGSDDATADVLAREMARPWTADSATARIVRRTVNAGRAAARNAGLDRLPPTADPVVFLDADVEPDPAMLERFVQALSEGGAVAIVARLRAVGGDPQDPYVRYLASSLRGPATGGGLVAWRHFLTTAAAVRHDALEAAGRFEPTITYGEDLDLAARLGTLFPEGLRVDDGPPVAMHAPGTLTTALDKVAEFARDNLPAMMARHPHLRAWTRADWLARPPIRAALALAPLVRAGLPWIPRVASDVAVRYVLAARFAASLRAGERAHTFRFAGGPGDGTHASEWAARVVAGAPPVLVERVARAAFALVAHVAEHGAPPGQLRLLRDGRVWMLDVTENGPDPSPALPRVLTYPVSDARLPPLTQLADAVERHPRRLRLRFR